MKSRKLLSLVLCICLLASVVSVCFVAPATALSESKTIYNEVDLSSKDVVGPTEIINLTFEGDAPYGIPAHRYASISYQTSAGYAKINGGGCWFFMGKDGTVGGTSVSVASNTLTGAMTEAVNNLYQFQPGKVYTVSFDYYWLSGTTVTSGYRFYCGLRENPINTGAGGQGATSENLQMNVISTSGFTTEWLVNGVEQTAGEKTTANTDKQTATIVFTPTSAGALGIYCGGTAIGSFAFDNYVVAELDISNFTSEIQDKLTFDIGGVAMKRLNGGSAVTETETAEDGSENKYLVISGSSASNIYFANTEKYGNLYDSSTYYYNSYQSESAREILDAVYSRMFKFVSSKTYKVTFKFRYAAGQTISAGTKPTIRLMPDPGGRAHAADALFDTNSWAKDISYTGLALEDEADIGVWQDAEIIFTVKTDAETSSYAKIRPTPGTSDSNYSDYQANPDDYNLTISKTGAYLGILCDGNIMHFDDYNVVELETAAYVTTNTLDFSSMPDGLSQSSTATGNTFAIYTDDTDQVNHSSVLKVTAAKSALLRASFTETQVMKLGNKYTITFDAKTDDDNKTTQFALIMGTKGSNSGSDRFIFDDEAKFLKNSTDTKFYCKTADDTEYQVIDGMANFRPSSEWASYKIEFDLSDPDWVDRLCTEYSAISFNNPNSVTKYLLFGARDTTEAAVVYYDNFEITYESRTAEWDDNEHWFINSATEKEIDGSRDAHTKHHTANYTKGSSCGCGYTYADDTIRDANTVRPVILGAKVENVDNEAGKQTLRIDVDFGAAANYDTTLEETYLTEFGVIIAPRAAGLTAGSATYDLTSSFTGINNLYNNSAYVIKQTLEEREIIKGDTRMQITVTYDLPENYGAQVILRAYIKDNHGNRIHSANTDADISCSDGIINKSVMGVVKSVLADKTDNGYYSYLEGAVNAFCESNDCTEDFKTAYSTETDVLKLIEKYIGTYEPADKTETDTTITTSSGDYDNAVLATRHVFYHAAALYNAAQNQEVQ